MTKESQAVLDNLSNIREAANSANIAPCKRVQELFRDYDRGRRQADSVMQEKALELIAKAVDTLPKPSAPTNAEAAK